MYITIGTMCVCDRIEFSLSKSSSLNNQQYDNVTAVPTINDFPFSLQVNHL